MDKIVLATFFDQTHYGCRVFSAMSKLAGVDTTFLNIGRRNRTTRTTFGPSIGYQGISGGVLYEDVYNIANEIAPAQEFIRSLNPTLLAISCRTFSMDMARDLCTGLQIPTIAGGWGPTLEPDRALKWADYVCFGEGDMVWQAILDGQPIASIPNIYTKSTSPTSYFSPLSSNDLENLPTANLPEGYQVQHGEVTPILPSSNVSTVAVRGCPMHCSYCMSGKYRDLYKGKTTTPFPKVRMRSVSHIFREIKKQNPKQVTFMDEVFPWSDNWMDTFCERWPKEIGVPFFACVRPEFHKRKGIARLIDVGLAGTPVGLQSASPKTLKQYNRTMTPSQALEMAKQLKESKTHFTYHIISGNPSETEDDLKQTLNWTLKAPCSNTMVFKLTPFPGSTTEELFKQKPNLSPTINLWYSWLISLAPRSLVIKSIVYIIYKFRIFKNRPHILISMANKLRRHP